MCGSTGIFPGWSRPDCQKTALKKFLLLSYFSPQLIFKFYRGFQIVVSKKTIHFQVLSFPLGWGSNIFQGGGGGGVQMLISIETHITCDCAAA